MDQRSFANDKVFSTALLIFFFTLRAGAAFSQTTQASAKKASSSHPSTAKAKTSAEFDAFSKRADAARVANQIPEAIDLYQKGLTLNPEWDEGLWYLGSLYYDADHYAEGLPVFRRLVEISPKFGPGWAMLGLCEFETKDYKNSIIHLQRSRDLGLGGNEELVNVTRYHEALLLNTLGQFESAQELLNALVTRGVLSENVKVALGMANLRVSLLPSQVNPSKDALVHATGEVATLVAQSNFDEANQGFQQLMKDFPNTPFLHYAYGSAFIMMARFDEAEAQFREEIKITPDSPMAYMQIAALKLRVKNYQEAFALAQSAIRIAPNAFPAHYLLGRAYLEMDNLPEAVKELEIARRLGPFSPEVRYNLARAYTHAHRMDDAARERQEFARLSGLDEQKQKAGNAQSYRSSSDRGAIAPREVNEPTVPH